MGETLKQFPFFFDPRVALAQAAGFVVFYLLLKRFLFDPVLRFVRHRDEEIQSSVRKVEEGRKEVEALSARYAEAIGKADRAAYEEMQRIVREAGAERTRMLAEAHERSRREVEEARARIRQEKESLLRELDREVQGLSGQILTRLTGRGTGV
ncbi:MAG: ATP synthase F0 subunit B [Planctomycetota bacterium]